MRILLAEDHRELRETTTELLRGLPAEVAAAADGVAAWRLFADDPGGFTLLVTDLDMPGMDGLELARRVRDVQPSCPIVFVTSRGHDPRLAELAGAAVVVKPFAPRQLERAVTGTVAADPPSTAEPSPAATNPEPSPAGPAAGTVGERRRARRGGWPLAAAVLVLGIGLFARLPGPPDLPPPPDAVVLRSTAVEPVEPVGDLARAPRSLRWRAVAGAAAYRAALKRVDGRSIFEATTDTAAAELPPEVVDLLRPGVTFLWGVEARGADGRLLARSPTTRCRLRLPTEEHRP